MEKYYKKLSIKVAKWFVILVDKLISGCNPSTCTISIKFIHIELSSSKRSTLKSSITRGKLDLN